MAHAGVGSVSFTTCLLLNDILKVKPTSIPVQCTGPSMNALIGSQIDYMCDQIVNAVPQVQGGTIKAYAIGTDERNPALEAGIRELRPGIPVLACTLVPRPTAPIAGRRVAVFTTAGAAAHPALHARLAGREGADVALVSGALADRSALRAALAQTDADVFVTELKAAAVDVVAEAAAARGAELVFLANEPVARDGSAAVDELLAGLVRAATETDS